jgi:hypothetical protein
MNRPSTMPSPVPGNLCRQLAPKPRACQDEPEPLQCEELEERVVPGGGLLSTVCNVIKKTAGWGC